MKKHLMANQEKLTMLQKYRLRPQKKGKIPNIQQLPSLSERINKQNIQKIQFNLQISKVGKKYSKNLFSPIQSERKHPLYLQKKLSKILLQKLPKIYTQRNQHNHHHELALKLRYNDTRISPQANKILGIKTNEIQHKKVQINSSNFYTSRKNTQTDLSIEQSQLFQNLIRSKNGYIKKGSKYRFYQGINHIIRLGEGNSNDKYK